MGKYISSIGALLIMFSQTAAPFAAAQTSPPPSGAVVPTVISYPTGAGTQAEAFSRGVKNNGDATSPEALAAEAVGCGVGQILGGIVQAGVSAVIGTIKGQVTDALGGVTGSLSPTVPVADSKVRDSTGALRSKEVSPASTDFAGAVSGLLDGVSMDSIGFCLANATVNYIAQSTVNWINSGFEGNPSFVDNPEKFFQDIADIEFSSFIDELGLGFMCSGVAPKVRIALVNEFVKNNGGQPFRDRHKCNLEQFGTNVEAFVNNYQNGGIDAFVEFVYNPASRPTSAYLAAHDELSGRIQKKRDQAQWELRASDFLNFKECDEVSDIKTRQIKKVNCRTYTPGQLIEQQIESTLNLPKDRLAIADEFDEIVAALVNQLIKTALSEVTSIGKSENTPEEERRDIDTERDNSRPAPPAATSPTSYAPQPIPNVSGTCVAATTTVAVDQPLELRVSPRGGTGSYIFDWLGGADFPTSTASARITVSFATATEASDIDVRIRSGGKQAVVACPAVRVTPPVPLEVSCKADDTSVAIGEPVTWQSTVAGGTGLYTYEWQGDVDVYSKNAQNNRIVYTSRGTYDASLKVSSGSQSKTVLCGKEVRVR